MFSVFVCSHDDIASRDNLIPLSRAPTNKAFEISFKQQVLKRSCRAKFITSEKKKRFACYSNISLVKTKFVCEGPLCLPYVIETGDIK